MFACARGLSSQETWGGADLRHEGYLCEGQEGGSGRTLRRKGTCVKESRTGEGTDLMQEALLLVWRRIRNT